MKLPQEFLNVYLPDLIKENVKIEMIGQMDQLPRHTKEAITKAIDKTKHNTGLILNIAMNYGSRSEIVNMVKSIAEDVHMNQLDPSQIDEQLVNNYLYTSHLLYPFIN